MIDVMKLLSMDEGKTLEFKRDLSSMEPILKTLIAFANTAGGILIVGRDDDGEIIGIEDVFEAEEKLANAIADSISPRLMPDIEMTSIEGKALLIVSVPHWWGPFYLKAKGQIEGVFIRLGSTNRVAGGELLEELNRSKSKIFFDQMPCFEVDSTGLDMEKIIQAFAKVRKEVDQNKLISLGILVPYANKLVCSNGGIILFGQDHIRERYFPNATVRCARFLGMDKVEFLDQYDVTGSILDAMKDVPNFIRRNTRMSAKIEKVQREDIPEYSPLVVREVLTNALVHADYSLQGMHPRVMIFSDRLEIESPGMLPFGYVLEDFMAGVSRVRNKVIARTFRELRMMEEWGTGYKRISEVATQGRYPLPHWTELGVVIKVTLLPYSGIDADLKTISKQIQLTPRQEDIIALFNEGEKMTAKEIFVRLERDIPERTLRFDLLQLKAKGVIRMIGSGPSTYWILESR